ncbi:MAG: 50S ribosomal protein L9, partial [Gammaproteobacteria bacterium]|nr:50S ribosomal protein L9 [Gammaproteobacteria bacterium]
MRVILQDKVANLGGIGDLVTVKPGYARNYLLPFGVALPATDENIKSLEKRRAELEKLAAAKLAEAKARATKLEGLAIVVEARVGEEGKLFGSVGPRDIADAVVALGAELEKSEISLPDGPIHDVGEHEVAVNIHT